MYINYLHFNKIDSTHTHALSLLSECPDSAWTAISADSQSAGKGQGQKTWQDLPGRSLLMTLVSPVWSLDANAVFPRHMAAAVTALRLLQPYANNDIQLKWPNDLYLNKRKLGGLLTEAQWSGERCKRIVFSIGVNVLLAPEGFAALDRHANLNELKYSLAEGVTKVWVEPPMGAQEAFVRHWRHGSMERWAEADGMDFLAQAVAIDDFGRIGLRRKDSNEVHWYLHGQVNWLGEA